MRSAGDMGQALHYFEKMMRIRLLETRLLYMFSKGLLSGTTHTCLGQEVCAVGVIEATDRARDIIVSNHRCHGHYIAFTADVQGLLCEIMGKSQGVCGGLGGSQHICSDGFYTNGIQGGIAPLAAGIAMAEKRRKSGAVTICFLGDGTMGQGVVYEALNMAGVWSLPVLFVLENNGYAQTTPVKAAHAGSFSARAAGFGVAFSEMAATDVLAVRQEAARIIGQVRENTVPYVWMLQTYRLGPHSKGDDFRPREEIEEYAKRDPLTILRAGLPAAECMEIETRLAAEIEQAVNHALHDRPTEWNEFLKLTGG